jgi:dolichyl-phosphate-mannose--protein O-mannosyl transferase
MMIVGSGVYFLTFLPNVIIGYSISDVIAAQWNMFNFHSGLVSSHPYASGWFTWPLILRPILFSYTALPTGYISSITAMGNPLIWWGGLSAMILSLYKGFRYRELPSMFIGILYVSQVTLFAFIPRELFIYHYYPATPLLVLAIVAIMNQYWKGSNEKKVITLFFIASFVLFLSFYPIISGMYVPDSYIKYLRWFKGWSF